MPNEHYLLQMLDNVNNCSGCWKKCEHRPKIGEPLRFNCFAYEGIPEDVKKECEKNVKKQKELWEKLQANERKMTEEEKELWKNH